MAVLAKNRYVTVRSSEIVPSAQVRDPGLAESVGAERIQIDSRSIA
jgi:hypothetical protein